VPISTLLLCSSATPTKQVSPTVESDTVGLDHRGRATLMRSVQAHDRSPHGRVKEGSPAESGRAKIIGSGRYRKAAWGTLTCADNTVPVSNELDCMDAAEVVAGNYQPVGSWHEAPEGCVIARSTMDVMYVNANATSNKTDFPDFARLCDGGAATPCPDGYDKEIGDCHPEWGDAALGSYKGGLYAETIEECKELCTADNRCNSFKWSATFTWGSEVKLVCILNTIHHPTLRKTWLDFIFCAKTQATIDESGTVKTVAPTESNTSVPQAPTYSPFRRRRTTGSQNDGAQSDGATDKTETAGDDTAGDQGTDHGHQDPSPSPAPSPSPSPKTETENSGDRRRRKHDRRRRKHHEESSI